jgi:polysaccharide pyruvyl transferase WcaK-like protein
MEERGELMKTIPKIIHYCWIGPAPKPDSVIYCIESWKKFCPDYEIREWNENNYDFTKNCYMKQAYEAKKWGFVPDYARLDIVYQYGGIYLDTDVELIHSLDGLLNQEAFMGFENTGDGEFFVNCGHGFGAIPHHEIIKKARDLYNHVEFLKSDGSLNLLASPFYTTQTLRHFGLVQENKIQKLPGMTVYTSDVLCPKNFRTGEIHVTSKTVSIHHFTASWMDDKIKKEFEHQQKLEKKVGKKIARLYIYTESVWNKYAGIRLITKLPKRIIKKGKEKLISIYEAVPYYMKLMEAIVSVVGKGKPILLDTAIESDNAGDNIIIENCVKNLPECIKSCKMEHIPTHRMLNKIELKRVQQAKFKILCGTNALSGKMRSYGLWKLGTNIRPYKNTILMGVGFDSASNESDFYTRIMLKTILSKKYVHSVRDSFSENKLHNMGIFNVINTGCPTMWQLTPEYCAKISRKKAKNVICTITDYCRNIEFDRQMLQIVTKNYEKVYLWIQGENDLEYLKKLNFDKKVIIVPIGLNYYDEILKLPNLDYIGTRLHAGIRAISNGHRSIIISIDNRAAAIAHDTGLPIIKREDIPIYLEERINSDFETKITLPIKNIELWKKQFEL